MQSAISKSEPPTAPGITGVHYQGKTWPAVMSPEKIEETISGARGNASAFKTECADQSTPKLGIVHFLCLGGLWGQVRIGRALPWARKVELCLVDTLRDDVLITKAFREVGLSATYLHAAGVYRIQEHEVGEDAPKVEVVVFEEDAVTQMVRRVGWSRRVLPPDCEFSPSLQCFPPQLVIPPLPAKQFGGRLIPVPREGIELQKYHYPNDWWLEVKPTDCTEPQETNA
ncbi:hypothetical protein WN48_00019 [Eufriesea mexicana]|uniref:Uncharacterized protein n=1 Tax=Eufriesea mexicana TaxID=516756 RepID=A0A310SUS5_9HYME|nr:hypothetical protein WN48_00019 [Eufriesea mexicana]